jgi:hypothetical protein
VQKGIEYGRDKRFVGFDIAVDDAFLDVHAANQVFDRLGVPRLTVVFEGTRREALQWAHAHKDDDVRPEWYGDAAAAIVPGNTGEGWVVRPVKDATMGDGDRFIFKIKSTKWAEGPVARVAAVEAEVAKTDAAVHRLVDYITQGRVCSVLSKLDDSKRQLKHMTALVKRVLDDATVDAAADGVDMSDLTPAAMKSVTKHAMQQTKCNK